MKIALVSQARVGSTRFPEKVLKTFGEYSLLEIHLKNALRSSLATNFIVATTEEAKAYLIEEQAVANGWECFKGSTHDVLERFYYAVVSLKPNYIVRITADCPLIQPEVIDDLINFAKKNQFDYASTSENFPDGIDVEIFTWEILEAAFNSAQLMSEREHVTPWIRTNAFFKGFLEPKTDRFKNVRLTVDEIEDFFCIEKLIQRFQANKVWTDYASFIIENPDLFGNQSIQRNEGYKKSLIKDYKIKNG
jgi:spore coat polysaccharide biosynthesis protein SpsF